jgi:hypothetical protein
MDTRINLINKSDDENNSQIVVFQKNIANVEFTPIAWHVVKGLGPGSRHPFVVPGQFQLDCADAWGNYTERQTVNRVGMQFEMVLTPSGDVVREADPPIYRGSAPSGTRFINRLPADAGRAPPHIQANAYKDGRLVAKLGLNPEDEGGFEFAPVIYVGAVSEAAETQAIEGQPLVPELAWLLDTKFSLFGIVSADLVMTGGGSGPYAPMLEFSLAKVVRSR